MITSKSNPKIKWVRDLQAHSRARREAGAFVIEGVRLAEEALASGWRALWVIYTTDLSPRGREVVDGFRGQDIPVEEVSQDVMKAVVDTESPQGILAVIGLPEHVPPQSPDFILVCDSIRDPGNLGTILRTASAAGVQAVLLSPGCADAFSPKVIRSGMGAHFRLPVFSMDWQEIGHTLDLWKKEAGLRLFLADSEGGNPYYQPDFRLPLGLVVGGEAEGAGEEAYRLGVERVHIPMPGTAESLNAAVATAVILFDVVRQRMTKE